MFCKFDAFYENIGSFLFDRQMSLLRESLISLRAIKKVLDSLLLPAQKKVIIIDLYDSFVKSLTDLGKVDYYKDQDLTILVGFLHDIKNYIEIRLVFDEFYTGDSGDFRKLYYQILDDDLE